MTGVPVGPRSYLYTVLDFQKLSATYQQALLRQVAPFWLKFSRDEPYGGYFDSLSATGEIIDGDKSVVAQAQQVWAFSWLYNTFDAQPSWLAHARHGATFLRQFAHDDTGACYAQLDRRGHPIALSSDSIPNCAVVMAYAQFHRAIGEEEWALLAKQTFFAVLQHRAAVRNAQESTIGGFRQIQHLSEPITVLKIVLDMQPLLDEETWKQSTDQVLYELLHEFMDRRTDTLREYILPGGAFLNTPEGRRLPVGLTFQTASYLLDYYAGNTAHRTGTASTTTTNRKQAMQVVTWCLTRCEQAWDEANGGLNQYVDLKQQPIIFPDWQQKWAWVQVEALSALIKGYMHTRHPDCLKWFKRIHDYTFHHFPDPKHLGWQLVIDQNAQPCTGAKAIPSVGCFSLIRCLTEIAQTLAKCEPIQPVERTGRAGAPFTP